MEHVQSKVLANLWIEMMKNNHIKSYRHSNHQNILHEWSSRFFFLRLNLPLLTKVVSRGLYKHKISRRTGLWNDLGQCFMPETCSVHQDQETNPITGFTSPFLKSRVYFKVKYNKKIVRMKKTSNRNWRLSDLENDKKSCTELWIFRKILKILIIFD